MKKIINTTDQLEKFVHEKRLRDAGFFQIEGTLKKLKPANSGIAWEAEKVLHRLSLILGGRSCRTIKKAKRDGFTMGAATRYVADFNKIVSKNLVVL